jgi:hypothetical protein
LRSVWLRSVFELDDVGGEFDGLFPICGVDYSCARADQCACRDGCEQQLINKQGWKRDCYEGECFAVGE